VTAPREEQARPRKWRCTWCGMIEAPEEGGACFGCEPEQAPLVRGPGVGEGEKPYPAPVGAEGTEKGGQEPITVAVAQAISGEANEWPHPDHPGCWVVRMKCPICNAHLIRNVHLNESHHPCHDPNCGRRL
jgi:hypothetical protein